MNPLPRPPTTFIGRNEEIARIVAHLKSGLRLVSLTGLGGIGKTRLALEVGARLAAPDWPVGYCDAVGLHSLPELAIALAAAADLAPRELDGPHRVAPHVAVGLALARRGPLLMIIDNFEQLAGVAAAALIDILSRAPELQFLLTSRVALMQPEEQIVMVHPLAADSPDSPAVDLLVARARGATAWQSDREALMHLAARLDGLPLALELAAARAQLIGPAALLALLDERTSLSLPGGAAAHPRRGSRDVAVAWSWDQLAADRRHALVRLAALSGSFDLELAAVMIGAGHAGTAAVSGRAMALEVLEVLARYSLLAPEHGSDGVRYRVLETVRDFVWAQASPDDQSAAHMAIAEALLARVEPHLTAFSRELPPAVGAQVARDRDLYLAVLRRGLDTPGATALTHALRVAVALVPLFLRAGFGPTATTWTTALLARPSVEQVPLPTRLGAALVTVVAAANGADQGMIDGLVARVGDWLGKSPSALMITSAFGVVHYYRWDHVTLLALADSVLRSDLAKNAEVHGYALAAQMSSRRALGRTTADDDSLLADAAKRLGPENRTTVCLLILTRAFLAIHSGQAVRGLELIDDGLARSGGAVRMVDALFQLERARAYHELGRLGEASRYYGLALSLFDERSAQRERQETLLDYAFSQLELGHYQQAAALLDEAQPQLGTSFEQGWHASLSHALALLTGVPNAAIGVTTGTVEDGAFKALFAIGSSSDTNPGATALACSFRVRRAWALCQATRAIRLGKPHDAIALSPDSSAFRAGTSWVDLGKRPLIRSLMHALAEARLAGGAGVDRAELEQVLWPEEKLSPETRDQRLHTAISMLRRLGLNDAIVAQDGGYRLVPQRMVVRVAIAAWPGPEGAFRPARGRGRPARPKP